MSDPVRYLNFHGLGEPGPQIPDDERTVWLSESRFEWIVAEVLRLRMQNEVIFTFDDGNMSDLSIAMPLLKKHGLKSIFFILLSRMQKVGYLTVADCRQLLVAGGDIGLHGDKHLDWRTVDTDTLRLETTGARDKLQALLGVPLQDVAIPFGSYNRRIIAWLRQSGFRNIYTSDGGGNAAGYIRKRPSLRADMDDQTISTLITGKLSSREQLLISTKMLIKRTFR